MGGRDHSCEDCGRGGFNDPEGRCTCPRPWDRVVEDATGLHHIEVSVDPPENPYPEVCPYPAMVAIEAEGGTVLAYDARRYALALLAAAEVADAQTDAMVDAMEGQGRR